MRDRDRRKRAKNAPDPSPPDRDQRNLTDPDSRVQPTRDGFITGYNGKIAGDAVYYVIVSAQKAGRRASLREDEARRGFRWFWLRGLDKVRAEWALICTAYNLLKLANASPAV